MSAVEELKGQVTELADLMEEFRLAEAELVRGDVRVAFRRRATTPAPVLAVAAGGESAVPVEAHLEASDPEPAGPVGTPIASPMHGIYYGAPSPSAAPFVKEGDTVTAGQVVALIEAMKVFNEITSTVSGTVLKIAAASGDMVEPGTPLVFIG